MIVKTDGSFAALLILLLMPPSLQLSLSPISPCLKGFILYEDAN